MAYQGYGQGADRAMIAALAGLIGLTPDLTIILDVSRAVAASRRRDRGGASDRYERQDEDFHDRVRAGFRTIAAAEPDRCTVVNADGTVEQVHAAIIKAVKVRLGLAGSDPRR
jgi:dTMP kinase